MLYVIYVLVFTVITLQTSNTNPLQTLEEKRLWKPPSSLQTASGTWNTTTAVSATVWDSQLFLEHKRCSCAPPHPSHLFRSLSAFIGHQRSSAGPRGHRWPCSNGHTVIRSTCLWLRSTGGQNVLKHFHWTLWAGGVFPLGVRELGLDHRNHKRIR